MDHFAQYQDTFELEYVANPIFQHRQTFQENISNLKREEV